MGGTFWVPVTLPSPPHFLQIAEQGSQDHLARRYLQICCANHHPHNTTQFIIPQLGKSAPNPGEVPHKNPAPSRLPNTLAPGSARPSRGRLAAFPEENSESESRMFPIFPSNPSPGAHTHIPCERPRSREVSPKICAHAESGPLFPLSASLLPSSSSLRASCASSAQRLSSLRGGNFFGG